MTEHTITVRPATDDSTHYGVTHKSERVYRTSKSNYPTRVVVWDNTRRPNPRNGEPVRYGEQGRLDGGNGRYLDPRNRATDDTVTVLLTTESIVLDAYGTGTGTPRSGQVWAEGEPIRPADRITLVFPTGAAAYTVEFGGNGHGRLIPAVEGLRQ